MRKAFMTMSIFVTLKEWGDSPRVVVEYDGVNGGEMTRVLSPESPLSALLQGMRSNFPWVEVLCSSSIHFPDEYGATREYVDACLQ